MRVWHTAQKIQMFGLIVRRHRFLCPFPHSFSISSISVHFLILSPFPHSLSISSFSLHFLILCPFPHSLSISSFSFHFLIQFPFPHSLSISSFSLHFLAARLQGCNNFCSLVHNTAMPSQSILSCEFHLYISRTRAAEVVAALQPGCEEMERE